MSPYVPLLVPELQLALIDPLPEVRATAAKALGSLLQGMGQQHFRDLMPWLLDTIKSEVQLRRHYAKVVLSTSTWHRILLVLCYAFTLLLLKCSFQ